MAEFSSGSITTFGSDPEGVLGVSHAYEQIGLGVRHERLLQRFGTTILVIDNLQTTGWNQYCLHWHLVGDWERLDGTKLQIVADEVEGVDTSIWIDDLPQTAVSERYGEMTPITLVRIEFEAGTCSVTSLFSPPAESNSSGD
jgi:hypothetical protein